MRVIQVYGGLSHTVDHCARIVFALALSPASFRSFENLLTCNIFLAAHDTLIICYIFIFLYLFHHVIHSFLSNRNATQKLLFQID